MVELDHSFTTGKPLDYNWEAILDLDRVVPCVEGGSVIERTSPESAKAEIVVKMGAMSMTFRGTVDVAERDDTAHRAVLRVKSKDTGGQGYANADVAFTIHDGGHITGSARVKQTDWGMKPYSALFGTLKVADDVEVAIRAKAVG